METSATSDRGTVAESPTRDTQSESRLVVLRIRVHSLATGRHEELGLINCALTAQDALDVFVLQLAPVVAVVLLGGISCLELGTALNTRRHDA